MYLTFFTVTGRVIVSLRKHCQLTQLLCHVNLHHRSALPGHWYLWWNTEADIMGKLDSKWQQELCLILGSVSGWKQNLGQYKSIHCQCSRQSHLKSTSIHCLSYSWIEFGPITCEENEFCSKEIVISPKWDCTPRCRLPQIKQQLNHETNEPWKTVPIISVHLVVFSKRYYHLCNMYLVSPVIKHQNMESDGCWLFAWCQSSMQ